MSKNHPYIGNPDSCSLVARGHGKKTKKCNFGNYYLVSMAIQEKPQQKNILNGFIERFTY